MNIYKHLLIVLATALWIFPLGAKSAERDSVERDTRMVSDTGSLDLAAISAQSDGTWAVAEVTPGAKDGRFEGVKRDAATGLYSQITGMSVTQVHEGVIKIIASIVGVPEQRTWTYEWDIPANIYKQYLVSSSGTADPYLAFYGDSVIVCRINSGLPTSSISLFNSKFFPIYLVPSQWTTYFVPALSHFHENADLFQSSQAPQNTDRLWNLTKDRNPIVAIEALRVLFLGTDLDEQRLSKLLTGEAGLKQAIFTFEVLGMKPQPLVPLLNQTGSSFSIPQVTLDTMNGIINKAKSSAELEGLAWGIWSATVAPVGRRGMYGSAKLARLGRLNTLLKEIQKRQNTFHSHTEEDARLNTCLRAANIPQQP